MSSDRLFYTRAARVRISMLPVEIRVHLDLHLENLAIVIEAMPERLPPMLERVEGGFATTVHGMRVLLTVDTGARSLFVHAVAPFPEASEAVAGPVPEVDT